MKDGVEFPAVIPRVSSASMKGTNLNILYASCVLVAVLVELGCDREKKGSNRIIFDVAECLGFRRLPSIVGIGVKRSC